MTTTAAATLRRLRARAGLSQEELADAAGLSSRTVRALESGQAKRPHRDTLLAVGRGVGLDGDALESYVDSWRATRLDVADVFTRDDRVVALQREYDLQRHRVRDRAVHSITGVDALRRWHTTTTRRRFEVISEQLDTVTWMVGWDPDVVDVSKVRVSDCSNVEVISTVVLREAGAIVCTARTGRTLRPGDVYEFEHTFDYSDAYLPGVEHSIEDDRDLVVLQDTLPLLALEVRFDPAVRPRRVWLGRRDHVDAPASLVREVVVNDFGIAQAYLEPAMPGVHGLQWEWSD